MSGHLCGVSAHIQQCEETAVFVHCLAHCTNLCLQTAGRQVPCIRDALDDGPNSSNDSLQREVVCLSFIRYAYLETSVSYLMDCTDQGLWCYYSLLQYALSTGNRWIWIKRSRIFNFYGKTYFGLLASHLIFPTLFFTAGEEHNSSEGSWGL